VRGTPYKDENMKRDVYLGSKSVRAMPNVWRKEELHYPRLGSQEVFKWIAVLTCDYNILKLWLLFMVMW
jgi:hypothetical protein